MKLSTWTPNRVATRARRVCTLRGLKRAVASWSIQSLGRIDDVVALTYDDGPDPEHTPRILDVLALHQARATFFLLSEEAAKHPEVVSRITDEGHEIGLHGLNHGNLATLSWRDSIALIRQGHKQLERVVGKPVKWFRPPHGEQDLLSFLTARLSGMRVVLWSAEALDWTDLDLDHMVSKAMSDLEGGGILLLHDSYPSNRPGPGPCFDRAALTDRILVELSARGLKACSLGQAAHAASTPFAAVAK